MSIKQWLFCIAVFIGAGFAMPNRFVDCMKRGGYMEYNLTGWWKGMKCNAPEIYGKKAAGE